MIDPQHERTFEDRLGAFGLDARRCVSVAYTWFAFDARISNDPDLLSRINKHAAFWVCVQHSWQATMFAALGRLYDDDRNTHSGRQVVKYAEKYPSLFSRAALRVRKTREGLSPGQADVFIEQWKEPTRTDLGALSAAFEQQRDVYVAKAKDIRDDVFAHLATITPAQRDALFSAAPLRDLEGLVMFPLRLHRVLEAWYRNGYPVTLDEDVPVVIGDVLAKPVPPHTVTWEEQRHAATDVARFVDWLSNLNDDGE